MTKVNKRKAQGAETKKKLYEIAEKLFAERDYTSVSVEDITSKAGITKGAFYVHFESKDALIAELIANYTAHTDLDYKDFLESLPPELPTYDVILAFTEKITNVLEHTIGNDNIKKVYQILLAGNVDTEAVKGYNRELYKLFYSILEKGIQRGDIKSTSTVEELSRHFVMAFRGLTYEWCIRYPEFNLKEQAIAHCRLLMEGLKSC